MEKTIGEVLKEKRKVRGLVLQQIHRETRIPLNYLTALEEDNPGMFPANIYYITSLHKYAKYLDLDIDALLRQQQQEKDQEENPKKSKSSFSEEKNFKFDYKPIFAIVSVFIVIGLMVYGYMIWLYQNKMEKVVQRQNLPDVKSVIAVPEKIDVSTSTTAEKKIKKHVLEARALVPTWLRVMSEGKLVYEGKINPERKMKWESRSKFVVRVGYVRGVEMKFNGQTVDLVAGSRGDTNEITLPSKRMKVEEEELKQESVELTTTTVPVAQ